MALPNENQFKVECPNCRKTWSLPAFYSGKKISCHFCNDEFFTKPLCATKIIQPADRIAEEPKRKTTPAAMGCLFVIIYSMTLSIVLDYMGLHNSEKGFVGVLTFVSGYAIQKKYKFQGDLKIAACSLLFIILFIAVVAILTPLFFLPTRKQSKISVETQSSTHKDDVFKSLRRTANNIPEEFNNSEIQFVNGLKYFHGDGVDKNIEESIRLFRSAAEQNHAGAQFCLAMFYLEGVGVPVDKKTAVEWLMKSALKKEPLAAHQLALCYATGTGIEQNWNLAVKWHMEASDLGVAESDKDLGYLYLYGVGVNKDEFQGTRRLVNAINKDNILAMYVLGNYYFRNNRLIDAEKYLGMAADRGHEESKIELSNVRETIAALDKVNRERISEEARRKARMEQLEREMDESLKRAKEDAEEARIRARESQRIYDERWGTTPRTIGSRSR